MIWGRAWAVGAVVLFATAAGCTSEEQLPAPAEDSASPTAAPSTADAAPSSPAPSSRPSPTPSGPTVTVEPASPAASSPAPGSATVTAFYVRDQRGRLWVEQEQQTLAAPTVGVARAAVVATVEGEPRDPALVTLAPDGTRVLDVQRDGDVVTVDLSGEVRTAPGGSASEEAFAQQLAWAGGQFPGVTGVRLLVDGQPVEELWGHLDWSTPIAPDEFARAPIEITAPAHGATVAPGPLEVEGFADVFEATLLVSLTDPEGEIVADGFVTASCGTGCRGAFTWMPDTELDAAGTWTVGVTADDASAGEGPPPFAAMRDVTVTG